MKKKIEDIYLRFPIVLQNLIVSIYGIYSKRIQTGKGYKKEINEVNRNLLLTCTDLADYQIKKIKNIISESVKNVPYYRNLFQRLDIKVSDINTFEDFKKIPILEKDILRKNYKSFINEKFKKSSLHVIQTTGTTGTPIKVYFNSTSRKLHYAFYERFISQNCINYKMKKATFGGRIIAPFEQQKPPFWRYSYFQKNLLFSSYHLKVENIIHYIDKLKNFRPHYIDSYPSSIYTIARYMDEHKIFGINITDAIITSAETLFPEQRELIEKVFGVPVYDHYGCAEMCVFIGQCRERNYHVNMDYGLVEFLNDKEQNAKEGEEARIVCTGFVNMVMPFIRYNIGDICYISSKKCKCGSAFPVIEKIIGRTDDIIVTPDGRKIGRLGPLLKEMPIKEAQFIQEKIDLINIRLVKDIGFTVETEKMIKKKLNQRLGNKIFFNFEYIKSIPRGKGGKYRYVISHLNAQINKKNLILDKK